MVSTGTQIFQDQVEYVSQGPDQKKWEKKKSKIQSYSNKTKGKRHRGQLKYVLLKWSTTASSRPLDRGTCHHHFYSKRKCNKTR